MLLDNITATAPKPPKRILFSLGCQGLGLNHSHRGLDFSNNSPMEISLCTIRQIMKDNNRRETSLHICRLTVKKPYRRQFKSRSHVPSLSNVPRPTLKESMYHQHKPQTPSHMTVHPWINSSQCVSRGLLPCQVATHNCFSLVSPLSSSC